MKAKACYLCSHPFQLIRHRQSNKQFCSKKCLEEWRAGAARALSDSSQQQERQRRFWGLACADWLKGQNRRL